MKKKTIAILSIAILAVAAAIVVAQKAVDHGFGGHRRGFGHGMMLKALNLTDDQKAKVKTIMESSKTSVQPLMESLKENHKKMDDLTANGAFDEAQVSVLATDQANTMAKLIVERERVKSQIFAILTDEQKAKAAELKQQMKDRFQNRMKKGGDGEKVPAGTEF